MNKFLKLTTIGLCLSLVSCQVPQAELDTYRAVAPRYTDYLKADSTLNEVDRGGYLDTVETWRIRVDGPTVEQIKADRARTVPQ